VTHSWPIPRYKFKLASAECGYGTELCRPPRLPLVGEERERVLGIIRKAKATQPRAGK